MKAADRQEAAYKRRMYYHKAQYSLDVGDRIENASTFKPETPEDVYFRKLAMDRLLSDTSMGVAQ